MRGWESSRASTEPQVISICFVNGVKGGEGYAYLEFLYSGWAPSLQIFRMWEMEDERGCISSLSGYSCVKWRGKGGSSVERERSRPL